MIPIVYAVKIGGFCLRSSIPASAYKVTLPTAVVFVNTYPRLPPDSGVMASSGGGSRNGRVGSLDSSKTYATSRGAEAPPSGEAGGAGRGHRPHPGTTHFSPT